MSPLMIKPTDGCLQTERNTEDKNSVSSETTTGYNLFSYKIKNCAFFPSNFNKASFVVNKISKLKEKHRTTCKKGIKNIYKPHN